MKIPIISTILIWRRDSHRLQNIIEARQISRQGALNMLLVTTDRKDRP